MFSESELKEHHKKTKQAFEENGYVVLSDVLNENQCEQLTQHLFNLEKEGKLKADGQCDLSGAIYGDPVFDDLLVQMAEGLGEHVGKKLLPTYSYARLYKPGEVLTRHKDRPSCEISATLTLGYDESTPVWPIYFDEHKEIQVDLKAGELAMYKGCEVEHWRTKFKGKWQAQVFLHYVDANGPHKEHAMDGRKEFGKNKSDNNLRDDAVHPDYGNINIPNKENVNNLYKIDDPMFGAVLLPKSEEDKYFAGYIGYDQKNAPEIVFTKEECDKIIAFAENLYPSSAKIGVQTLDRKTRSADVYELNPNENTSWLFQKVCNAVHLANRDHFHYDVNTISHGLQLIHYRSDEKIPGHYDWHVDAGPGHSATRKISFTVQLSDSNDYKGCDLLVQDHHRQIKAIRDQGSLSMFPSYMPHCVTPIESGERWALVIWVHGPKPFR